ncbi:hypothetical protein AXF42_Ash005589 [Apostasia shenzhenica]|uniref:Uncharacterized protein n=1 Tax=Apostasia shenzhenica TaxID=1088818 RepID=A0A2I0BBU0_9ASPA|nr:hypothetical protein AXF42_Ash005589 [Apostasia shenzhenica]
MERCRRLGSYESFREKRRRKKVRGLPPAVLLSFKDRGVHPQCPCASNPFHKCADYCFDKIPQEDAEKEILSQQGVNRNCKNASNPYHLCAEYCFPNVTERKQPRGVVKLEQESSQRVNPECKYASNPYHICAEYCIQRVPRWNKPQQEMNLKGLIQRWKIARNSELTPVQHQCEHASNPYHECAEYCFQNVLERSISKIERSHVKPKCRYAPNPYHTCNEYCFQGIQIRNHAMKGNSDSTTMLDRTVKSSVDFKRVEELKEDCSFTAFPEGSKILDQTEGFFELDLQPLRLNASDLLHEWAKICSQKKVDGNNDVNQNKTVGKKEFLTRNWNGDNAETIRAKGYFQRFISSSILFSLGILFALFYWAQQIHSVHISSERIR